MITYKDIRDAIYAHKENHIICINSVKLGLVPFHSAFATPPFDIAGLPLSSLDTSTFANLRVVTMSGTYYMIEEGDTIVFSPLSSK